MKKLLFVSALALVIGLGTSACAESVSGKVVSTDGNSVTVRQQDGTKTTMQVTPDTTYRKKKIAKQDKMKKGHHVKRGEAYYQPMLEEDDWVDIIYSPSTGDVMIIEDVVIYDD